MSFVTSFVSNPNLPFWGQINIPNGVRPGTMIIINGRVNPNASKFHVNLVAGEVISADVMKNGDIGFHFNPRFDQNGVVRNTCQRGVWGPEEWSGGMPFAVGQPFEMIILIDQTDIKVAVNSKHFIEYKHRLSFTSLKIVHIDGDVSIQKIEYRQEPAVFASQPHPAFAAGDQSLAPVLNPSMPFRKPLNGGLRSGMMMYVSGRPSHGATMFTIDFVKAGGRSTDVADIAFHFNARYNEQAVVRNSRINGEWGTEERAAARFPFTPGVNFDMIIRVEGNRYLVAVNGQHFVEYYHRISALHTIDLLHLNGDVSISSIRFHVA